MQIPSPKKLNNFIWFGVHCGKLYPYKYRKKKNTTSTLLPQQKKKKILYLHMKKNVKTWWSKNKTLNHRSYHNIFYSSLRCKNSTSSSLIKTPVTTRNILACIAVMEHVHLSSSWSCCWLSFQIERSSLCNISHHLLSEGWLRAPHGVRVLQELLSTEVIQSEKYLQKQNTKVSVWLLLMLLLFFFYHSHNLLKWGAL